MANGVELATAYVSLTVDGSSINSGVRKSLSAVGPQADRVGKNSGRRMGDGISKGILTSVGRIAGPLAAVFATIGIGKLIGDTLDEAREAQVVAATTDAIVKSTGGVAKVTAKHVNDLSDALSKKIGVDDEAIAKGANLLLTFKNVRNEAGKGGNIFDQAVASAQDLSKAGFGSIESASKMLGKALNDPVKGMTALGRAGVTFSEAQKEQIKSAVKNNDLLGAQKIILGEVQSQVGGVAEAAATTGDKVKVAFGNLKEDIGTALLPMLDKLGRWFLEDGLPAIQKFGRWVKDDLWPALKDGWETVRPALKEAGETIAAAFGEEGAGGGVKDFASFITEKLIPAVATFVKNDLPQIVNGILAVIEVVKALWGAFQFLLGVVRTVTTFLLDAFIKVNSAVATMLEALSHVPGFGWAKDAAAKLRTAAEKAQGFRDAINDIPETKSVTVTITAAYENFRQGERDSYSTVLPKKRRAHGGPVVKGQTYLVGERRPEVFVPNESGRILPRVPSSAPAATGGFNDPRALADAVYDALRSSHFAVDTRENVISTARHQNTRGQM